MNALITKEAELVECVHGQEHEQTTSIMFGCDLAEFLQDGGVRVKVHNDEMAIESFDEITSEQRRVINRMLRDNIIYVIFYQIGKRWNKKSALRPIKSLRG